MAKCDNCPAPMKREYGCQTRVAQVFSYTVLQEDLLAAIKEFYSKDVELLVRNVNEVCITSHIFHYFASKFSSKYGDYNIDPEYNKNGYGAKYYRGDHYAKPDLIIHRRNCNRNNLLYAEFKTNVRCHDLHDKGKIARFVSNDFGEENGRPIVPYRYKFGVSIVLNQDTVKMLWYQNGQKVPLCENVFSTVTWEMV